MPLNLSLRTTLNYERLVFVFGHFFYGAVEKNHKILCTGRQKLHDVELKAQVTNLQFCLKIALLSDQDYESQLCRAVLPADGQACGQQSLDAGRSPRLECCHLPTGGDRLILFNNLSEI